MRKQVTTIAIEAIREKIIGGDYAVGDALKCQPDLAKELGVSRASLREALSTLETLGYLRIEPGKGTYVASDAPKSDAHPRWKLAEVYSDKEAFQARLYLEATIAAECAHSISMEGIEILKAINNDLLAAWKSNDLVRVNELDMSFHKTIVQQSANALLIDIYRSAQAVFHETQTYPIPATDLSRALAYVEEHESLINALFKRDRDAAFKAMQLHIQNTARATGVEIHILMTNQTA